MTTNICECCWRLGKTCRIEKGYVCVDCVDKLNKLKEVDNNGKSV